MLAAAAAATAGIYFYRAGGDPKLARNKLENDAHRASVDVKSHLPGRHETDRAQDKLAGYGARAGAEVDRVVSREEDDEEEEEEAQSLRKLRPDRPLPPSPTHKPPANVLPAESRPRQDGGAVPRRGGQGHRQV
jgi:hypothetical protein